MTLTQSSDADISAYSSGSIARAPAPTATVRNLPGPSALRSAANKQYVVVRVARLARLQATGDRMLPVDVDAIELRIRLQEIRAGAGEGLTILLGGGHFVERSRVGPAADRQDELQVRILLFEERDLMEEAVRALGLGAVAGIHAVERNGPVERQLVASVDLAERVVDVCQLVGGNVSERIAFGGPVGVVADDLVRGSRCRRRGPCLNQSTKHRQ